MRECCWRRATKRGALHWASQGLRSSFGPRISRSQRHTSHTLHLVEASPPAHTTHAPRFTLKVVVAPYHPTGRDEDRRRTRGEGGGRRRAIIPSTHPLVHPLIHTSVHPPAHPSIHPPIHPSANPSIYIPTIHPSIQPPIHTSIHPPTHPSILTSLHPSIRPHIQSPIHPFIHPSIRKSIDQ